MKEKDIIEMDGKEYYVLKESEEYVFVIPLDTVNQQIYGMVYREKEGKLYELETDEEKRKAIKWLESILKNENQE